MITDKNKTIEGNKCIEYNHTVYIRKRILLKHDKIILKYITYFQIINPAKFIITIHSLIQSFAGILGEDKILEP